MSDEMVAAGVDATLAAMKLEPENAAYVDTLARLYSAQDKLDKAIETQKKAIEMSDEPSLQMKMFLSELEKEAKGGEDEDEDDKGKDKGGEEGKAEDK